MGNVDSSPPHSHHHHGQHGHGHANVANGNGHIQNSVYAGQNVHQVVDTRGAPIGSDYVDVGSALEAISREEMEQRFLQIVVSSCHTLAQWVGSYLYPISSTCS